MKLYITTTIGVNASIYINAGINDRNIVNSSISIVLVLGLMLELVLILFLISF